MVQAYYQAVSTLNLLRAFTKGGFADLTQVHTWNQEFVTSSLEGRRYEAIANEIGRALRFMQAIGIDLGDERTIHEVDVWTSHEALLLDYEEPLVRRDSTTGDWYACSAHFLWVGERTRQLDGAHVEFLAGVDNPVGVKVGPTATPDELVALCERLNPDRDPRAADARRPARRRPRARRSCRRSCARCARRASRSLWACDPMHANTFLTPSGHKTRRFDDVLGEIEGFFAAHREVGTLARRRPPRDHGRGRDGVPRRLRGGARGAARPPLRDALRPAAQRAAVARPRVPRRRADAGRMSRAARRWRPRDREAPGRRRDGADRRVGRRSRRGAPASTTVVGWDPDAECLAHRRGARRSRRRRRISTRRSPAAELVVVAAPVGELPRAVREVLDRAPDGRTVTDVGSTKRPVVRGRGRRPALRRRPPDLRCRDAGAGARDAPSCSTARRGSSPRRRRPRPSGSGSSTGSSPRSARAPSRSIRTRTTGSSR